MNKKQFEIWQRQKWRDYEIELEKLRDDFANRGLAYSGMRMKAEDDLKQKYKSEIEITRLGIKDDLIIENSMEDNFENMSEDELNAIVRRNENSYVPTSRFNHAKNELEIRHRKKIEEIASRGSSVSIVNGHIKNSVVAGNTVNYSNNKGVVRTDDIPLWFKWVGSIVVVLAFLWGIYIYFFPNQSIFGINIISSQGTSDLATTTPNISDILIHNNNLATALEQQDFLKNYKNTQIYGSGSFTNIAQPNDNGYDVTMLVADNELSCQFDNSFGKRLLLFKKGQIIKFTGIFTGEGEFGGGWYITNCTLLD